MNYWTFLTAVSLIACGGGHTTYVSENVQVPIEYVVTSPEIHLTKEHELQWAYCVTGDRAITGSCMYVGDGPREPNNGHWYPSPDTRGYFCETQGDSYGVVRVFAICSHVDEVTAMDDAGAP